MAAQSSGPRRLRDSLGSRRVLAAFGVALLVIIALIGFAVGGIGRGGASVASTTPTIPATAVGSAASVAGQSATLPTSSIPPATPIPPNTGMEVKGVSPDNAMMLPHFYYNDGTIIGAKVYSDPEQTKEVMLGQNSWLLLSNGDRVEVLENLAAQTVKIRILSNKYDGTTAGVIGREVYVKGWVITGELFSK